MWKFWHNHSPILSTYSIHTLLLNKKKIIFNIYYIPFHVKITPHSSYILTWAVFKLKSRKKKRQTTNVFGRLAAQPTNLKKTTCCNRSREKTKLSQRKT